MRNTIQVVLEKMKSSDIRNISRDFLLEVWYSKRSLILKPILNET